VPGTSKKSVKRSSSPQTPKRKPKNGTRTKKAKKNAPRDFWQAVLFTAVIITASALISTVVLGINQGKTRQIHRLPKSAVLPETEIDITTPELTAPEKPEEPFTQESSSVTEPVAVSKPLPEKQTPVSSAPKPKPAAEKTPANKPDKRQSAKKPAAKSVALESAALPELPPKPARQGTLVFIIDDAGNNLNELEPFLRFPGPLTIAVLPGLPHSAETARRIRAAGKEVFLHQPMEAIGGQDPGPGAIYTGMNAAEILAILNKNIAEIGPVAGINNHQGSRITMDQQAMETVLAFCRERGICFLDSRTTAQTVVPAVARNLGIKIGERNIFIDNEQTRQSMNRYIENGLTLAAHNGSAVMIGHTWSPELAPLLTELYQNVITQGYTLATASAFITQPSR